MDQHQHQLTLQHLHQRTLSQSHNTLSRLFQVLPANQENQESQAKRETKETMVETVPQEPWDQPERKENPDYQVQMAKTDTQVAMGQEALPE